MADMGLVLLTVAPCYALQVLQRGTLQQGRLQDRQ